MLKLLRTLHIAALFPVALASIHIARGSEAPAAPITASDLWSMVAPSYDWPDWHVYLNQEGALFLRIRNAVPIRYDDPARAADELRRLGASEVLVTIGREAPELPTQQRLDRLLTELRRVRISLWDIKWDRWQGWSVRLEESGDYVMDLGMTILTSEGARVVEKYESSDPFDSRDAGSVARFLRSWPADGVQIYVSADPQRDFITQSRLEMLKEELARAGIAVDAVDVRNRPLRNLVASFRLRQPDPWPMPFGLRVPSVQYPDFFGEDITRPAPVDR